jgi:Fe-S-cluster containining protein
METSSAKVSLPVVHDRASVFSYKCGACSRCCFDKVIPLGPYEVARLAHNRAMSTADFLRTYTTRNGTALLSRENGACVFLDEHGCSVHADRPLACRLYPLGRIVGANGVEYFVEVEPHPETAGVYGTDATVADYVTAQGIDAYTRAADLYHGVLVRVAQALDAVEGSVELLAGAADTHARQGANEIADAESYDFAAWLDVDSAVAEHCRARELDIPDDVEAKVVLHVQVLSEWLDSLEARPVTTNDAL